VSRLHHDEVIHCRAEVLSRNRSIHIADIAGEVCLRSFIVASAGQDGSNPFKESRMDGLTEGPVREPSGYRCRHLSSFFGHEGDDGDIGNGAAFSGQLARAVKFMGPVL